MSAEGKMSTEDAGRRFLLAFRRLRASHSGDAEALREYAGASAMLLATFADTMGNVSHAATACRSYCSALIHSAKNVKRPRHMPKSSPEPKRSPEQEQIHSVSALLSCTRCHGHSLTLRGEVVQCDDCGAIQAVIIE